MSTSGPITTAEQLDARLDELRASPGDPGDFEPQLRALAADLGNALSPDAMLRIARVGCEAYAGRPDEPSDTPPAFAGRPSDTLDLGPVLVERSPLLERGNDESVLEHGRRLAEDLERTIATAGLAETDEVAVALATYGTLLAMPQLLESVPLERSLDLHPLLMIATERMARSFGLGSVPEEQELAMFAWLHRLTRAEVTPDAIAEVGARRAVRLDHPRQPPDELAVLLCETPLGELPFAQLADASRTVELSLDSLQRTCADAAARGGAKAARWAARGRGLTLTDALDLTPASAGEDHFAEVAHGHLLRWLLDHGLPVRPHRMGWGSSYTHALVRYLVLRPSGREFTRVTAHLMATSVVRESKGPLPLSEELVLLAWVMEQTRFAVRLGAYLDARAARLVREAERAAEGRP